MSRARKRIALWSGAAAIVLLVVYYVCTVDPYAGSSTKTGQAQMGCQSLATAVEAYVQNSDNPKHEFPAKLADLLEPPFGGPSFLRNGAQDLLDPWGKPYQMELVRRSDGTEYLLIKTTAPDGREFSQYGIGKKARPRLD
jgi:general secretion pathway protein G